MYPYLFNVDFLDMYTILLVVGLFVAVLLFKFICGKKKVDDKTYNFYAILAVISIALGLVFAFLFQAVYNWIEQIIALGFASAKFEFRGMTFMGGLIGGVLTFVLGTVFFAKGQVKRNFFQVANYAAPCIVIGHVFGRLGCFAAGCCYGKHSTGFWGVKFPVGVCDTHTRTSCELIPTQLYEAIFLALVLTAMLILLFKYNKSNFLLIIYGFAYSIFRFFIEYLRGDPRGEFLPFFSPSQWQSIFLLLITAALAIIIYKFKIIPFAKAKLPTPPEPK